MIEHQNYYNPGKYEAKDVIRDWDLNFNLGNAVKYICRAGKKDPNKLVEDLVRSSETMRYLYNMFVVGVSVYAAVTFGTGWLFLLMLLILGVE